jgi:hypothetical protein
MKKATMVAKKAPAVLLEPALDKILAGDTGGGTVSDPTGPGKH